MGSPVPDFAAILAQLCNPFSGRQRSCCRNCLDFPPHALRIRLSCIFLCQSLFRFLFPKPTSSSKNFSFFFSTVLIILIIPFCFVVLHSWVNRQKRPTVGQNAKRIVWNIWWAENCTSTVDDFPLRGFITNWTKSKGAKLISILGYSLKYILKNCVEFLNIIAIFKAYVHICKKYLLHICFCSYHSKKLSHR